MMGAGKKSILVVEDDEALRQTLCESLEDEGYRVSPVCDGQEALDWLSATPVMPHAIITDLLMPRVDGWQLWDRLRLEAEWKTIPVFILSTAISSRPWPEGATPTHQMRKPPDLHLLLGLLGKHTGSLPEVTTV